MANAKFLKTRFFQQGKLKMCKLSLRTSVQKTMQNFVRKNGNGKIMHSG